MGARILRIETALPETVLTNADLGRENPDWDMDRLCAKTGILERRISAPGQTATDLAFEACQKVIGDGAVRPDDVDYLILCTQSPDNYLPSGACRLQHQLGLRKSIGAFDFNLGCSGYVYGLQLAASLIQAGEAKNVLLATADTYTKYIHPRDRMLRVLFGDGAAATLIGTAAGDGIGAFVVGTDGAGGKNLIVPAGGLREPRSADTAAETTDAAGCTRSRDNLYMDGSAIFTFALRVVPPLIQDVLNKAGLTLDQIGWFVYHQANEYMLNELAKRSSIPPEKVARHYDTVGNTVSASIPLALSAYNARGQFLPGQKIMLLGFGVGYSWGGCVVEWA